MLDLGKFEKHYTMRQQRCTGSICEQKHVQEIRLILVWNFKAPYRNQYKVGYKESSPRTCQTSNIILGLPPQYPNFPLYQKKNSHKQFLVEGGISLFQTFVQVTCTHMILYQTLVGIKYHYTHLILYIGSMNSIPKNGYKLQVSNGCVYRLECDLHPVSQK